MIGEKTRAEKEIETGDQMYVYIPDRYGFISELTLLLGNANANQSRSSWACKTRFLRMTNERGEVFGMIQMWIWKVRLRGRVDGDGMEEWMGMRRRRRRGGL